MRFTNSCTLGALHLKNGFIMAPVKTAYGTPDGRVTKRHLTYHANIARGGAAMVILEPVSVTQTGKEHPKQLTIHLDTSVSDLAGIVSVLHEEGSLACLNLNHAGRAANPKATGTQPSAPSAVICPATGQTPKELTIPQIKEILAGYRTAMKRAREAGFDAVEIQCGHGYLVSQFLSPRTNLRSDAYGKDRTLFLDELFRIVKQERDSMAVLIRISGSEFADGGLQPEDNRPILKMAEEAGFDAIHCGNGSACDSPPWYYAHMGIPEDKQIAVFRKIREMTNLPLILTGRMADMDKLALLEREDLAQAVGFGRALIADPKLPAKLVENRPGDITLCGYCLQGCLANVKNGTGIGCIVNPGIDSERPIPLEKPLNVAVVGGGPAGMTAAATLAETGATVTLYEQGSELGGQFRLAPLAPHKDTMNRPLNSQLHLTNDRVKSIKLNTRFTPNMADAYDHVIVASGSRQNLAEIQNLDTQHWMTSLDFFENRKEVRGKRVLIVGAGMVGMEAAEILTDRGLHVTATKRTDTIANDMEMVTKKMMMNRLKGNSNMIIMPETTVLSFGETGIRVLHQGVEKTLEPVDTVILASGMLPETELFETLKQQGKPVTLIGDADHPADIFAASQSGYRAALSITKCRR